MGKFLDETGVSWLIAKIKSVFLTTEDAEAVDVVDVDATPTQNSTNLVESGGVYSALAPVREGFKYGVISQTQTWSGTNATGYDYVMSDLVYGNIPQANIDLYKYVDASFNATTGYFEMNGLTDISYVEMNKIYTNTLPLRSPSRSRDYSLAGVYVRTNCSIKRPAMSFTDISVSFAGLVITGDIEVVCFDNAITSQYSILDSFRGRYIKTIKNEIKGGSITNTGRAFDGAYSLETVSISALKTSVSFSSSSRLSLESIVYMVNKAANTSAITITLHATAYARCQADTTEYTYNSQTYTGILAYASAKNITIASA